MALITVTPATTAAMKDAQPGDTLKLVGDFSALTAVGLTGKSQIALDLSAAVLGCVTLNACDQIEANAALSWPIRLGYRGGLNIAGSTDIRFAGADMFIPDAVLDADLQNAVTIAGSSHVYLPGLKVTHARVGVSMGSCSFVEITDAEIRGCVQDAINGKNGVCDVLIQRVLFRDAGKLPGVHVDAVQIYSTGATATAPAGAPCHRVRILDCDVDQHSQGFSDFGNYVEAEGWEVGRNRLKIDHSAAIVLGRAKGKVWDNVVSTMAPDAIQPNPDWAYIRGAGITARWGNKIAAGAGHASADDAQLTDPSLPPPPPPNGFPVAVADAGSLLQDHAITFAAAELLANDSDPEGQALTITGVSDAANGAAVLNVDGSVTFTPNAGFYGSASFIYAISDGAGGAASAVVLLDVTPADPPPPEVTPPELPPVERLLTVIFEDRTLAVPAENRILEISGELRVISVAKGAR